MKKKIFTTGIIAIILFFSTAFCYAAQTENTSKHLMSIPLNIFQLPNAISYNGLVLYTQISATAQMYNLQFFKYFLGKPLSFLSELCYDKMK